MSNIGYDVNRDVTAQPVALNVMGNLQAGQNFSEGLLKNRQQQKLADLQNQYSNAPDAATQLGLLKQIAVLNPEHAKGMLAVNNQGMMPFGGESFKSQGANIHYQALKAQYPDMPEGVLRAKAYNAAISGDNIDLGDNQAASSQGRLGAPQPESYTAAEMPMSDAAPEIQQQSQLNAKVKTMADHVAAATPEQTQFVKDFVAQPPAKQKAWYEQNASAHPQLPQTLTPDVKDKLTEAATQMSMIPTNQTNAGSNNVTAPSKSSLIGAMPDSLKDVVGETSLSDLTPIPSVLDNIDTSQYSPETVIQAKRYLEARTAIPKITMRTPQNIKDAINLAQKVDPTLDDNSFTKRKESIHDITVGKGAQTRKSANMLMQHLDGLATNFAALDNSSNPEWYNKTKNELRNFRNPDFQEKLGRVEDDAISVSNEMATILRNTGMSEADIKQWKDKIDTSKQPGKIKGTVGEALNLVKARLDSVKDQYENGMRIKIDNPLSILSPKSQEIFNRLEGNKNQQSQAIANVSLFTQNAKAHGYTDAEIQAHLKSKGM